MPPDGGDDAGLEVLQVAAADPAPGAAVGVLELPTPDSNCVPRRMPVAWPEGSAPVQQRLAFAESDGDDGDDDDTLRAGAGVA